jgi:hypothetical protein
MGPYPSPGHLRIHWRAEYPQALRQHVRDSLTHSRLAEYGGGAKSKKAAQQPPLITSDRFPLANADEKQEPAKQLMRFCMHLETSALSTNRLGINRLLRRVK